MTSYLSVQNQVLWDIGSTRWRKISIANSKARAPTTMLEISEIIAGASAQDLRSQSGYSSIVADTGMPYDHYQKQIYYMKITMQT